MRIPSRQSIIDRASDQRADAVARHDSTTIRGIDTLIKNLYLGLKMRWDADGALIVRSVSTPGAVYAVGTHTCSCPAHKPCYHQRLRDLLLEMLEVEADSADMDADLVNQAAPLIDALDAIHGDADFEADCDAPAAPVWRIGAVIARRLAA